MDYVDVYLLHQPTPADFDDPIAAYQVAEQMLAAGKARFHVKQPSDFPLEFGEEFMYNVPTYRICTPSRRLNPGRWADARRRAPP